MISYTFFSPNANHFRQKKTVVLLCPKTCKKERHKMAFYQKILAALLLVAVLATCLFGCGFSEITEPEDKHTAMWRIGVCASDDSEFSDIIMDGFSRALSDELPHDSVTFTREFISNEKSGAQIASDFVRDEDDLILTIGTPALKGASRTTEDVPIITTNVTDIQSALQLSDLDWNMRTNMNVTGVVDMPNLAEQLALIIEVTPGIKTLAIVYSKTDLYSDEQSRIMQDYLTETGIEPVVYELSEVKRKKIYAICRECDAIFIPSKSNLSEDSKKIAKIAAKKNIPTIGGDVNIGKNTLVCLCPDYYDMGYKAGMQAAQILGHGKNAGKISIEFNTASGIKLYNGSMAKKIGITFPKSFHLYDQEDLSSVFSDR